MADNDMVQPPTTDITPATPESGSQPNHEPISDQQARVVVFSDKMEECLQTAAGKINDIEQDRQHAEKSRANIDAQLSAMQEVVSSLQQKLDSANALITQITTSQNEIQAKHDELVEIKAQASSAMQSIKTASEVVVSSAAQIEAVGVQAKQTQEVIATKSDHIESARVHADKVRGNIDRLLTQTQQSATNAESQYQAAQTVHTNLVEVQSTAQSIKASMENSSVALEVLLSTCEKYAATTKKLADVAETTEQRISKYEERLAELSQLADDRFKQIEELLPGATGAGLASAFNKRRTRLGLPKLIWQTMFVASVLGLITVAVMEIGIYAQSDAVLTWDKLGMSLLHRLPLALPLIWLALYSSNKAYLFERVEEDYAFKETTASAFEGFRRQMAELEGKSQPGSSLSTLCTNVLAIITDPPGKIYEKHKPNDTPISAVADAAKQLADAAEKITKIKIVDGD